MDPGSHTVGPMEQTRCSQMDRRQHCETGGGPHCAVCTDGCLRALQAAGHGQRLAEWRVHALLLHSTIWWHVTCSRMAQYGSLLQDDPQWSGKVGIHVSLTGSPGSANWVSQTSLTCTPWWATEGSQLTFLATDPPVFRAERISNAGADTDAGVLRAPWAPPT